MRICLLGIDLDLVILRTSVRDIMDLQRITAVIPYREQELSKKLPDMTEDEQLALLATDGMLVKRPLLVSDSFVLTGFKEEEWKAKLL